jgi:two-component system sensor histidine kinase BaeS
VSDTGPGLTSEEREHAFERFYLYEHCKEKRTVGTGLGLAIVKQLVDAMGGEVTVESEEAAGTAFCVRLPLAPEAGEPES